MTYHSNSRRAFTLVELLVVIAIIGVLVALLLPAVQAARESARRIQCTSTIKNLALATLNYESANKKFPPAYLAMTDPSTGQLEKFGGTNINASYRPNWVIMVLPYLEQQPLFDQFVLDDFDVQISDDQNLQARGTVLPAMRCPSDPNGDTPCSIAGGNWARGNYGINMIQSGNLWDYKAWEDSDGPRNGSYGPRRGIAFVNQSQTIAQVADGTTNTILFAELRTGLSEVDPRGSWAMGQCAASAHAHHAVSWGNTVNYCDPGATDVLVNSQDVIDSVGADTLRQECMHPWSGGTWSYRSVVRSLHPGGAMIAMADGSARMISDFVDKGSYNDTDYDQYTAVYQDGSKFRVWERLNVSDDSYPIDGEF